MKKVRAPTRPSLSLSLDDTRELRALVVDLEREFIRSYESFVFHEDRRPNERRWKPVKTHEQVHFFRERKSYKRQVATSRQTFSTFAGELDIGPQAAMAANWKMPLLFGTGTIPGSLEDLLYGSVFHDTASLRARNFYINETMAETAVLGVVDPPTQEDPFRFLGVVWYYRSYPVPGIIANRDAIMVLSSHATRLSNGEMVSMLLFHSIDHRDAPERRDLSIVRAQLSFSMLCRQIDVNLLEVYFTSFVEFKGSTPEIFVVNDVAQSMLNVTNLCECALRRKLLFRTLEAKKTRGRLDSHVEEEDTNLCAMCDKKTSRLFQNSSVTCQICRRRVCTKCSVTKEIVVDSTRTSYTVKPFDFCLACTIETKRIPAATIARKQIHEWSLARRSNSTSSAVSTGSLHSG